MTAPAYQPEETPWFRSWTSMGVRAWSDLENSQYLPPALVNNDGLRYGLPWLRIWEDAMGFGCEIEPFTLTVIDPFRPEDPPLVRRAIWQSKADFSQLHDLVEERHGAASFEPTITVQDAAVPAEELQALLRSGLSLRIPLMRLSDTVSVTSDVGSVGFDFFTLDQPQARVSLEWSFDPPPEWEPALDFVRRLQAFLEGCLQKAG